MTSKAGCERMPRRRPTRMRLIMTAIRSRGRSPGPSCQTVSASDCRTYGLERHVEIGRFKVSVGNP